MTQETINYIMQRMASCLDNGQMMRLKGVMDEVAKAIETDPLEKDSSELLKEFLATKRLEGRSDQTLFFYQFTIEKMIQTIDNNWSRDVLLNFLETDLYERQGKAITNFTNTLPANQSDLAQAITLVPEEFKGSMPTIEEIEAELNEKIDNDN